MHRWKRHPALIALLSLTLALAAAAQNRTIAVTPFANAGASKADDYLGFQFAEFAAGALAGIPGMTVVERTRLAEILSEQELQLSGITEAAGAAKVGAILNAGLMLTGSFAVNKPAAGPSILRLSGRFVDVSTGAVLGAAELSGPFTGDPGPLFRPFLEKLLSSTPGFGYTIGVEARVAARASEDSGASADYARALAAQFSKNDEEARKYLEAVVTGDRLLSSSYAAAAASYVETVTRIEGSGIYARMLQSQVEKNARLMEQVEPLTIHRNTLKILLTRMTSLVREQDLRVSTAGQETMEFGDVAALVRLPAVTVGFDPALRAALEKVIGEQDIARLDDRGLRLDKAPPPGLLLSDAALRGLFDLALRARAGYSVVFHDKAGTELFRLDSEPISVLDLSAGAVRFQGGSGSLRVAKPRNGWAVRPDGSIEIQARELATLAGVRYIPQTGSLKVESTYPVGSDLRWKSLVLHAYRRQYIKIARSGDPSPSVKDVAVADSFFETADPGLGRIPIVPEDTSRAGYAQLTAVVYFADSTSTTVQAGWDGLIKGESEPFTGALNPRSILYFPAPSVGFHAGIQTVTIKVGTDQQRTEKLLLTWGFSWKNNSAAAILLYQGILWSTGEYSSTKALETAGGKERWIHHRSSGSDMVTDGRFLFIVDSRETYCLDRTTGAEVWVNGIGGTRIILDAGRLYVVRDNSSIICVDPVSGKELWRTGEYGFPVISGGRIYLSRDSTLVSLDATTGQVLWSARRGASAMALADGKLYLSNGWVLDAASGKEIIQHKLGFSGKTLLHIGDLIYITDGSRTASFHRSTGAPIWEASVGGSSLILGAGKLYVGGKYALDAATGKEIWRSSLSSRALILDGRRLFVGGNMLDLSVLERD